jgi:oligopeptide transport system substrate-binding protein
VTVPVFRHVVIATSLLALTACGGGGAPDEDSVVLRRGNNAEPFSLDPHKAAGTWENNIIGDMFIGMFTEDASGAPIPGMAESWEVSEDQLVWTFTLREAYWSDGVPVTANDFVYGIRRITAPETNARYVSLLYPIAGVQESVETGDQDAIQVRAIDDRTLEITLVNPAPYLIGLLTHYTTFPIPAHVVEEHGDAWIQPENVEVNGAYKLEEWSTGEFVHLVRNERFYDNANVCVDDVYFYPTIDNASAGRRVRNGELDLNMEFPGQQLDFFRDTIPEYIRIAPYMGTVFFFANTEDERFTDARVRNALAMAIDREFIAETILGVGQPPAYSLVPPGMENYQAGARASWADTPVAQRRVEARRLLEEAGYGPDNPFQFDYIYRNTGDNPTVAPVVQRHWSLIADWVEPSLIANDTQIHYANLSVGGFQLADGGWIADFNDPYNFLYLAESRTGDMNYARYSNPDYDDLVDSANAELDLAARAGIMAEAEQILLDDMPIIPIVYYVSKNLVRPDLTGWEDNLVNIHRTRYLCFAEDEAG